MTFKPNWKLLLIVLGVIFLVVLVLATFLVRRAIYAPNENVRENTLIEIDAEKGIEIIARDLAKTGLIRTEKLFYYMAKLEGLEATSGFYEITPQMSMRQIADLIGSGKVKLLKVTIPEGFRLEQIGVRLNSLGIVAYADFISAAKNYEGKLFPDTFFMPPRMTAAEVIAMMQADYQERTAGLNVTDDVLVLASIVEREAAGDSDRAEIAGIYANRLKIKMKLEADPTGVYARDSKEIASKTTLELKEFEFWKPMKISAIKEIDSPFNTYLVAGLPPEPICNPGLASIKAALEPAESDYLYFIHGRDDTLHPARTFEEHEANIAKYL